MASARHRCFPLLMAKDWFTSRISTSHYDNSNYRLERVASIRDVQTRIFWLPRPSASAQLRPRPQDSVDNRPRTFNVSLPDVSYSQASSLDYNPSVHHHWSEGLSLLRERFHHEFAILRHIKLQLLLQFEKNIYKQSIAASSWPHWGVSVFASAAEQNFASASVRGRSTASAQLWCRLQRLRAQ